MNCEALTATLRKNPNQMLTPVQRTRFSLASISQHLAETNTKSSQHWVKESNNTKHGAEANINSHQHNCKNTNNTEDDHQLLMWVYETSTDNMTFAEKMERVNWEVARPAKLWDEEDNSFPATQGAVSILALRTSCSIHPSKFKPSEHRRNPMHRYETHPSQG